MSLYMESTKIDAVRTVAEIQEILGQYGASAIMVEYTEKRKVKALSFQITIEGVTIPFRLPCRVEPVSLILQKRRDPKWRAKKAQEDLAQAERVAWRQILRWVQAQLAIVDTGMVAAQEVFLPYLQTGINETLYERINKGGFRQIPWKKQEVQNEL